MAVQSAIVLRRPDIRLLISDYISSCSSDERVGIGGCGPIEMIDALRQVVLEREISGPSVTLHTEVSFPLYFDEERLLIGSRSLCGERGLPIYSGIA